MYCFERKICLLSSPCCKKLEICLLVHAYVIKNKIFEKPKHLMRSALVYKHYVNIVINVFI